MKTLEQKIILALHPECKTQEEALKKENDITRDSSGSFKIVDGYVVFPISLPRVIQVLNNNWKINPKEFFEIEAYPLSGQVGIIKNDNVVMWKLIDENAKDLNLEDQSEETREALSKLFNV